MNYLLLKGILEATLSHFVCRGCSGKADERFVEISDIHDSIIHIDVKCPHCGLISNIKAEVNMIGGSLIQPENFNQQIIKKSGSIFDSSSHVSTNKKGSINTLSSITDDDILKLRDTLGNSVTMSDLFGNLDN